MKKMLSDANAMRCDVLMEYRKGQLIFNFPSGTNIVHDRSITKLQTRPVYITVTLVLAHTIFI